MKRFSLITTLRGIRAGIRPLVLSPDSEPFDASRASFIFPLAVVIGIFIWQIGVITTGQAEHYREHSLVGTCGTHYDDDHIFTYGIFYWHHFPLLPDRAKLPEKFKNKGYFFSEAGARDIMDNYGTALRMDMGATLASGNILNLWIPYLDALVKGSPRDASYIPFNRALFMFSLLICFLSFYFQGRWLLGLITVIFVGSYPFQIYSAYYHDNIFSYQITSIMLLLGICAPLMFSAALSFRKKAGLCILAGITASFMYMLRADCITGFLACITAVTLARNTRIQEKAVLFVILAFCFMLVSKPPILLLEKERLRTVDLVKEKGGTPLPTKELQSHIFWYTIWCGLDDFDTTSGVRRYEFVADKLARDILVDEFNMPIEKHPMSYYNRPPDDCISVRIPEFDLAMRKLVLRDIARAPLWYASILVKRVYVLFGETIPAGINLLFTTVAFKFSFIFYAFIGVLLIYLFPEFISLILFVSATACIPLLVTTLCNYKNYSIAHLLLLSLLLYALTKTVIGKKS